jgi:ATP-dependent DNA ligase
VHLRDKFRIELNARANPAVYHAFDILNLDGAYLVKHPLRERKRLLDQLGETEHVKIVRPRPLEELTRRVEAQEIEGIVAKDMNSAYELRRSPSWVKYRPNETEDLLCLGWEDSDKSDRPFRSLILKRGNREVQASSGLTHDELETLLNLFAQEPVQKVGTKNYFKTPKIIVEVEYSRRPELSYRFPHIKRIRLDKLAKGG